MCKCNVSTEALNSLDNAMDLICKEMNGRSTENVMILAKVLRDIMVARAILTEMTDTLGKF